MYNFHSRILLKCYFQRSNDMKYVALLLVVVMALTMGMGCKPKKVDPPKTPPAATNPQFNLNNAKCPVSGKAIDAKFFTFYTKDKKDYKVLFCSKKSKDAFDKAVKDKKAKDFVAKLDFTKAKEVKTAPAKKPVKKAPKVKKPVKKAPAKKKAS